MNGKDKKNGSVGCEGITFSYTRNSNPVINNFTSTFGPNKLSVIIGPNGSGKSTLARIIIGYLTNFKGILKINGLDTHRMSVLDRARLMAFVPQETPISAPLTVREALELGRFCHHSGMAINSPEDKAKINEVLELTGLVEFADARLDEISGGEKQRAMVARAIAQDADNIILDEPTASLDLKYQPMIFNILRGLVDNGYNIIAISHDVNLASRFADKVYILKNGKMFASGKPEDVIQKGILEDAYDAKLETIGERFFMPVSSAVGDKK